MSGTEAMDVGEVIDKIMDESGSNTVTEDTPVMLELTLPADYKESARHDYSGRVVVKAKLHGMITRTTELVDGHARVLVLSGSV